MPMLVFILAAWAVVCWICFVRFLLAGWLK